MLEEEERRLAEERKRLEEEAKELRRDERRARWAKGFMWIIILILILLIISVIYDVTKNYLDQKAIDDAIQAEEDRIALEEELAKNASDEADRLEAERLAALEAARLAELEAKMRRDDLKRLCTKYFDEGMDSDYDDYAFNDKDKAKAWLENATKIRLDKTKTFDERVYHQIRSVFLYNEIQIAESNPIAIAVGDVRSTNFNESAGMVCVYEGLVEITGDGRDNLLYQVTMRREWV